jgi:DNA repair protein RadC
MLPRSFFSIITLYVDFGVAESSRADEAITQRLKEALALIDVRVIDHFVVTAGAFVSFAERGLI